MTLFQATTRESWIDDADDLSLQSERISTKCLIGLTLAEVRDWADKNCKEFGENSILLDLNTDEEFPSIEIERKE